MACTPNSNTSSGERNAFASAAALSVGSSGRGNEGGVEVDLAAGRRPLAPERLEEDGARRELADRLDREHRFM